jgi:TRAP-type C4-dicarboxylate transport system permease small subunit
VEDMIKAIDKLTGAVNKILLVVAIACLLGVVLFCFLQVFTRFVIKTPILGAEEMAQLCFAWMIFCGVGLCSAKRTHAAVTIFKDRLPQKIQIIHQLIVEILVLILVYIIVKYGWVLIQETKTQFFGSLRLSITFSTSSILMCGFSLFINAVNNIVQNIAAVVSHGEEGKKQ